MRIYHFDILEKDLNVIFCGINPAPMSHNKSNNFSSKSNRFWTVLHLAGFTPHKLEPQQSCPQESFRRPFC
ncbi:uracil-DNA glycosylase family protein [Kordiimonas gwangyangensis]|uniref:uracil-DNA glycosylase family protein n=1 Tax=Kordiimonas gwangyangensis TaxID=288022 RepID=UPI0012DF7398